MTEAAMNSAGAAAFSPSVSPTRSTRAPAETLVMLWRENVRVSPEQLSELAALSEEADVELVLVRRGAWPSELRVAGSSGSHVRLVATVRATSQGQLRVLGLQEASGDVVTFVDALPMLRQRLREFAHLPAGRVTSIQCARSAPAARSRASLS